MKYAKLTKEQFDLFNQDFEFRTINNKINKLKIRLEKRKDILATLNDLQPLIK